MKGEAQNSISTIFNSIIPYQLRKRRVNTIIFILAGLGIGVSLPFFAPSASLAAEILILAIFAMGFNIFLGYTGLISFGHAAYYGLGAYACGLSLMHWHLSPWLAVLFGGVIAVTGAVIVGSFALRKKGIYFSMITLAFAQALYFIVLQWQSLTGGKDGLLGIPPPQLKFPFAFNLQNSLNLYYFCFLILGILTFFSWRLLHSPFGKVLQAVRESSERAEACGYRTRRIKLISFAISGLYAGFAGALYTMLLIFVPIQMLNWPVSGEIIVITLLGGQGTFLGPFIGSTVYLFLKEHIMMLTPRWHLFVGAILIVIVLAFPTGVVGTLKSWFLRYSKNQTSLGQSSSHE